MPITSKAPVGIQFVMVHQRPFSHEAQRTPWQRTRNDLAGGYRDNCFLAAVPRVKMRWRMVAEVHLDHDPIELTDPRHGGDDVAQNGRDGRSVPIGAAADAKRQCSRHRTWSGLAGSARLRAVARRHRPIRGLPGNVISRDLPGWTPPSAGKTLCDHSQRPA